MRLRSLLLKGITRFAEPVSVNFAALGEGLVAIAGRNGAGKTTIMESAFAALHMEFPTRPGGLYGVAHGKDARLELEVETNGVPYRCLVAIDALRSTSEAYLYSGDGTPVTPTGKIRDYQAAIAERFGSPRLMLAAALSTQNKRGSFLDLSKVERKSLLAEVLDVEGLQVLSESARERAKAAELAVGVLRGVISMGEREMDALPVVDLAELQVMVTAARAALTGATWDMEEARKGYTGSQAALERAREITARRAHWERDAAALFGQVEKLQVKAATIPADIASAKDRAMVASMAAEAEARRLPEYQQSARELASVQVEATTQEQTLESARHDLTNARCDVDDARAKVAKLDQAERDLSGATQHAELLGLVPCSATSAWILPEPERGDREVDLAATCPLLANARDAAGRRDRLAEVVGQHAGAREALEKARAVLTADIATANKVEADLRLIRARVQALTVEAAKVTAAEGAAARVQQISEALTREIAAADARHVDLRDQIHGLVQQRSGLLKQLETEPEPDVQQLVTDLEKWANAGKVCRARVDAHQAGVLNAERDMTRAEEAEKRRSILAASLDIDRDTLNTTALDQVDWRTLERAFGRDGIQALEIDAAGPELSSLTNELLTSCFDERFQVTFVTQLLKADGKGYKESFDVQIKDNERGREGAVDSLSGGEKTIVSEAISLALAVYVGRHSGRRFETLFRDETAGQLDPDNAAKYVSMLRKARVLSGAWQVVFIAQQPEVWGQADAVLWVEDGRVEVRQ